MVPPLKLANGRVRNAHAPAEFSLRPTESDPELAHPRTHERRGSHATAATCSTSARATGGQTALPSPLI